MINQELAKLAISNENTPELGEYWQKRYEKFLKNNVFILSEKTNLLIGQKEPIDSPATPYGYINLPVFLGKNKIVDEVMLQNCIETAIRFLDSILENINFTAEARQLINQNRKIGVGVINFEEYYANRDATSKVNEIDYIGEIISSSSYRASEALAEEKGPCDNWYNLAFIIRPKPFEYWYNSETGEVKSGLDIAEEFTSTNLLSSHFEIIPRRNSHILFYPNDQEWQIWSDRDDNSIISTSLPNIVNNDQTSTNIITKEDDNDYTPSFEKKLPTKEMKNIAMMQTPKSNSRSEEPRISPNQFTNPAPIDDLPLVNPISTLQQKISKWFAVDSANTNQIPKNSFDLTKNSQEIEKTNNDLPIPKVKESQQEPNVITQIKKSEGFKENPHQIIKEVEVIKKINKPILVQIVSLSSDAKKVLVDKNNILPRIAYSFEREIEIDIKEKINQNFGVQVDFMEISSVDLFEGQIYIAYQAKILELTDNSSVHFDFIEALNQEEDTVAYSKSIDRVRRWQQSSKIKAQELLKEYNHNLQKQDIESESKIIIQKNAFIEELQTRIKKSEREITDTQNQKNSEISDLITALDAAKLELQNSEIKNKSITVDKIIQPVKSSLDLESHADESDELILVKNDNLMFDLNPQTHSPDQQNIPTINIDTNSMSQNQNLQYDVDANQATFKTSRDKMFMPTLEIETRLGVPVIVNTIQQNNSDIIVEKVNATDDNSKSSTHADSVLLKLKRLTSKKTLINTPPTNIL